MAKGGTVEENGMKKLPSKMQIESRWMSERLGHAKDALDVIRDELGAGDPVGAEVTLVADAVAEVWRWLCEYAEGGKEE